MSPENTPVKFNRAKKITVTSLLAFATACSSSSSVESPVNPASVDTPYNLIHGRLGCDPHPFLVASVKGDTLKEVSMEAIHCGEKNIFPAVKNDANGRPTTEWIGFPEIDKGQDLKESGIQINNTLAEGSTMVVFSYKAKPEPGRFTDVRIVKPKECDNHKLFC